MKLNIKIAAFLCGLLILCGACKKTGPAFKAEENANTILNVSYGGDTKQNMDVYLPANRNTNTGIIILVHGGTSIAGDKSDFTKQAKYLSTTGYAVLNVNYRLVNGTGILTSTNPPHLESQVKIKDQVTDMSTIVDYAIAHADGWVVSKNRIVMIGHSAGANISLLYSYDSRNNSKVKAVVNLAGPLDFLFTDIPNWQLFPPALLELGYRYTGFEVTAANEKYYQEISPLYVANVGRKVPTLNVLPQNNDVAGLPKMDVSTYNKFTAKLNELKVPNEYFYVAGADHNFSQTGKWEIALTKSINFFDTVIP